MIEATQIKLHSRMIRLSNYLVMAAIAIAIVVLLGWLLDIPVLRRPLPGFVSMNPASAVCFFVLGIAFFLHARSSAAGSSNFLVTLLSLVVIVISLAKLSSAFISTETGIDTFLFTDKVNNDLYGGQPNRMAPNTAVCFFIAGVAVLLLNYKNRVTIISSQLAAFLLFLTGLLSLLGYMYGVNAFYGVFNYTPMALHTAVCFVLLALGILFINPGEGFLKELTTQATGGISARILIPFAILIPATLGLIRIVVVRAGFITTEFGTAIHVLSIIVVFLAVIWYVAVLINRKDKLRLQAQLELAASKAELEKLNSQLEEDVKAKTIEISDIFQRVSDVFYAIDNNDVFKFLNPRAAKVFGFSSEELLGKTIWDFFPKETVSPEFQKLLAITRETMQPQTMELFSRLAKRWFLVNMYPSDDGISLILQDITEKREADELLKKEKAFSDSIVKSLPGIFYYYDEHGKFLQWNKNFETVSGYSGEEISQMTPDQFFADEEKDFIRARIGKVFTEGYADAEAHFLTKDGTKIPYYFTGIKSEYEGKPCLTGVGFEITERKKAEEALLLSEKKYRLLFEWNPIPMWMLSLPDFNFIDVNNAALKHYGYSKDEFLSMNAADIRRPDEAKRLKNEILQQYPEVTNAGIWMHLKKNREEISVEVITHDIQFGEKPVRLVLANDVTERMKARQALETSNSMLRQLTSHLQKVREDERKHIAREIHDELGQQLTVIKMDVSWIKKKTDIGNTAMLQKLDGLLNMLDDTVKTVRELSSRLRPSLLDDLGLIAAIEWHLNDFRQRTGLSITADLPEFEVDLSEEINTALFRIMQESLTNVARHSGAKNVKVRMAENNDKIVLSIKDDGRGFAEQVDTGKRTLGILGMKERAAEIGGIYTIEGEPGKGTLVSVSIPNPQYSTIQNEPL